MGSVISGVSMNKDAEKRAQLYLKELRSFEGNTHYLGMEVIRKRAAQFIANRDNAVDDSEQHYKKMFLSNGASAGIKAVLKTLITSSTDAVTFI